MKKTLLLALLLCGFTPSWADVSPKPEMEFSFIYNTADKPRIAPEASEQIQCQDNQCLEAKPLGAYGLQKLYCGPERCFSIAYEYADYQKLIIGFEDGSKRESNIFKAPRSLRAGFTVYVNVDSLSVRPSPAPSPSNNLMRRDAWASFLIILLLELAAAWAYLTYSGKPYRTLYAVAAANMITTPVSWCFLAVHVKETAFLWIFCFLFEAAFIWAFNRRKMSLQNALNLSLAMNVTSYSLGMMISFFIAPWLF